MEVTITISIGSILLGFLLGTSLILLILWLTDREMEKDDRWHKGFSQGWDRGYEYGKIGAGKEADNDRC